MADMNRPHIFHILILIVTGLIAPVAICQPSVRIQNIVVNEPPPGVDMTAGYFKATNAGNQPVSLVKVTSPDFGSIEMHRSIVKNGVASMVQQDLVTIPPNSSTIFKPGGYHLMMFHPKKQLAAGDTVFLTFYFSDSTLIQASARVKKAGASLNQDNQRH